MKLLEYFFLTKHGESGISLFLTEAYLIVFVGLLEYHFVLLLSEIKHVINWNPFAQRG